MSDGIQDLVIWRIFAWNCYLTKQQIIQQLWIEKSIAKRKIVHWMHLRPLNLRCVIEESLLEEFCFRPWLHETGTNSDRYDFRSVSIQMLVSVYIRPVWETISCRFHSFRLLNRHEWLGPVWSRTTEPCKHEPIWDHSKITVFSMRISVVGPFQDGGKQQRV